MGVRELIVTSCEAKKQGTNKWGKPWTLFAVKAQYVDGTPFAPDQELKSWKPLPVGQKQEYEVHRQEFVGKKKTFVSYELKVPKAAGPTGQLSMDERRSSEQTAMYSEYPTREELPPGRYAVTVDGELMLVHSWRPPEGRERVPNVQKLYVVKIVSDKLGEEEVDDGEALQGTLALATARKIVEVGPGEAALEFGRRTGCCSRCGASLSNNLSRELAIGPVCMKHWFDGVQRSSMKARAREKLRAAGIDPNDKYDALEVA